MEREFLDLCQKRQSCRNFSEQTVELEKLKKCVEAGALAPSGCNAQPWSFVVVSKPEVVAEVAIAAQQLGSNKFLDKAQAFILVYEEYAQLMPKIAEVLDSQYFAKGDLGAATMSICLEAADLDLGTCMIGLYNRAKINELVGREKSAKIASVIAVGYPEKDTIRKKIRKPLEDVVTYI